MGVELSVLKMVLVQHLITVISKTILLLRETMFMIKMVDLIPFPIVISWEVVPLIIM